MSLSDGQAKFKYLNTFWVKILVEHSHFIISSINTKLQFYPIIFIYLQNISRCAQPCKSSSRFYIINATSFALFALIMMRLMEKINTRLSHSKF